MTVLLLVSTILSTHGETFQTLLYFSRSGFIILTFIYPTLMQVTEQDLTKKLSGQESVLEEKDRELSSLRESCSLLKTKLEISADENRILKVCSFEVGHRFHAQF